MKDPVEGEPGVDSPILSAAPETSFECTDRSARKTPFRIFGVRNVIECIFEAECQVGGKEYDKRDILGKDDRFGCFVHYSRTTNAMLFQAWHQCFGDRSWVFLCPNGTIFNQVLICILVFLCHFDLLCSVTCHYLEKIRKWLSFFFNFYF